MKHAAKTKAKPVAIGTKGKATIIVALPLVPMAPGLALVLTACFIAITFRNQRLGGGMRFTKREF